MIAIVVAFKDRKEFRDFIEVQANQILKLMNASSLVVDMNPNTIGIQFPVTVASLNIHCLDNIKLI